MYDAESSDEDLPNIPRHAKSDSHNDEEDEGYAALVNAMNTQLLKERQEVKEFMVAEQFSSIFDSIHKAKLTSGFIQGTIMSLPVGFT